MHPELLMTASKQERGKLKERKNRSGYLLTQFTIQIPRLTRTEVGEEKSQQKMSTP